MNDKPRNAENTADFSLNLILGVFRVSVVEITSNIRIRPIQRVELVLC